MRLLRGMHSSSCCALLSSSVVSFACSMGLVLVQIPVREVSTNTCRLPPPLKRRPAWLALITATPRGSILVVDSINRRGERGVPYRIAYFVNILNSRMDKLLFQRVEALSLSLSLSLERIDLTFYLTLSARDATRALEACPSWEVAGRPRRGYARPSKYVISSVV